MRFFGEHRARDDATRAQPCVSSVRSKRNMGRGALALAITIVVCAGAAACGEGEGNPAPETPLQEDAGPALPLVEAGALDARIVDAGGADRVTSTPDAAAFAGEKTPFSTAEELCAWVNQQRQGYAPHDRWRGLPVSGEYHQNVTWPMAFTVDPSVSALADAEAKRVAAGGAPAGTPVQLNFNKTLWFSGLNSSSYQVTSSDVPGDWIPAQFTGDFTAGLTTGNPAARMGIYYQDPGGGGPVLARMGCGAALAANGQSRHWVILLRP